MQHNYRIMITSAEFGEILARNIQESLAVEDCKTINVHVMTEDGKEMEMFNTDDAYALQEAITDIVCDFSNKLNKEYPKINQFGLDIFESQDSAKPYLQIDAKLDLAKRKVKFTDLRFPNVSFWDNFGFSYGALAFIIGYLTDKW